MTTSSGAPMKLQGFRFYDAPCQWVIEKKLERVTSIGKLLEKFYDLFTPEDDVSFNPLAVAIDPEKNGDRIFGKLGSYVLVIYRRDFYVVIEKNFSNLYGPHAAQLMYKSDQTGEPIWIAILQIEGLFYSQDKLVAYLTDAIKSQSFFQTPETSETIVFP